MARIRIPCLVGKTNKAGVTSWYWQPSKTLVEAGWRPISLGKDMNRAMAAAQARNAEVDQWKVGGKSLAGIKRKDPAGTFGALVQRYRREVVLGKKADGRDRLAPKTRETYETALKRLVAWAGKHPVAFITPARVRALRDANAKPVEQGGLGHSATYNLLKTLRQVMAFAERVDVIPKGSNPATEFELGAPPPRRRIWSADDEAAFIAAAYDLGRPSMALAIELAIYTAQREGDLIAFTEPQLQSLQIFEPVLRDRLADKDGEVLGWVFNQGKTSDDNADVVMEIPFEPKLLAKVQAAIRTNRARDRAPEKEEDRRLLTYILVDDKTGLPWNKRHFIRTWTKIIEHAVKKTGREDMRGLVWHDLRRTRVVRLRRRGMPKEMIASITGHSLQSITAMLKVYGPIDPTITAAAIVGSLEEPEAKKPGGR